MQLFTMRDLAAAYAYAEAGGQALHLMDHSGGRYPGAPRCFQQTTEFGHLLDADHDRLVATARQLGVRVIRVSREGQRGQHIDLCGKPLANAKALCRITEGEASG
jgi:monoamine oxidase